MFFAQVMLKVRGVIEPLQQTTRQQNEQCACVEMAKLTGFML